jgi:hypothetical protein
MGPPASERPTLSPAVERYVQGKIGTIEDAYRSRLRDQRRQGEAAADRLVREHESSNPGELATATGATVVTDEWSGLDGLIMLGTYADGTITVFEAQVRTVADDGPLSVETVRDVAVAHELAHHVLDSPRMERDDDRGRLTRLVERARGNGRRQRQTVLAEVAAHTFAGALVDVAPHDHPLEVTERVVEPTPAAADAADVNRE